MRTLSIIFLHGLVLTIGTLMAFHPTILSGGRLMQTDPGDTLLNHFVLEHEWRWLSDHDYQTSFWSPTFFYPQSQVLAYSENLMGAAPIYWLMRSAVSEITAFQLWMIVSAALTYITMACVMSRLGASPWLTALGAAAFAFGLPRISQLSHQQLLPSFFSPLAVYWAWRFLESPTIPRLMCISIFTYLQLIASFYLGWFLALGLTVLFLITITGDSHCRDKLIAFGRQRWLGSAAVVITTAWILVASLEPYIDANRGFHRHFSEVRLMLPRLESWVSPPPGSFWANVIAPATGPLSHEHHLFPGLVFAILFLGTAILLICSHNLPTIVRCAFAVTVILMLISLNFGKISAWKMIFGYVPGGQAIRAVTRIFTVVYLFGWIAVALAANTAWRSRPRMANVCGVLLLLCGLAEQWQPRLPAFDPAPFFIECDRLASQMNGNKVVYVESDAQASAWVSELAAMWAGLKAKVPVVNGYSGRKPPKYPDGMMDERDLATWLGTSRDVKIIGPARLASAYPMPNQALRPTRKLQALRDD